MKTTVLCLSSVLLATSAISSFGEPPASQTDGAGGQMARTEILSSESGFVLKDSDKLATPESFRPPVEITIVAKTDSTNLRMSYAADDVIFNWEWNRDQLRVDGGPANGHYISGAGAVPRGEFVTIKWIVTPEHQEIFVDDQLRFEHSGDYSSLDKPVCVYPALGSQVTVKSLTVRQLRSVPPVAPVTASARPVTGGSTSAAPPTWRWPSLQQYFPAHGNKALAVLGAMVCACVLIVLSWAAIAQAAARTGKKAWQQWLYPLCLRVYWPMLHFGNVMALRWRVIAGVALTVVGLAAVGSCLVCPIYSSTCRIKIENDFTNPSVY